MDPEPDEHVLALADASRAAVLLGSALAEFQNALDRLRACTPRCPECGYALARPHARRCSQGVSTEI